MLFHPLCTQLDFLVTIPRKTSRCYDMEKEIKLDADVLIKRLEEQLGIIKEERQKLKSKGDCVEVIIKVKKKKAKDGRHKHRNDLDVQTHVHRAGSWGDLLLKKKQVADSRIGMCPSGDAAPVAVDRKKTRNNAKTSTSDEEVIAQLGEGPFSHAPNKHGSKYNALRRKTSKAHHHHAGSCGVNGVKVQVPASDGSYKCCNACTCHQLKIKDQESQTTMSLPTPASTVKSTAVSPPTKDGPPQYRQSKGENEGSVRPKISHSAPDKSRPVPRRISTSRRSANIPVTRVEDAEVQTRERDLIDETDHAAALKDLKKLSELEMENAALKRDTEALLAQMNKAKAEKQEYITTIKELYELAEVLRHENVILIGTHEEHRSLQEKLIEALGENQVLKQHLQELTTKSSETEVQSKETEIKDFWKVRDVLKEVKTVIAEEINGLQKANGSKSPIHMEMSDIVQMFERAREANGMNDTNIQCDDEIQKILNVSKEVTADRSDLRSSTQYLEVEESHAISSSRRYVPSPSPSSDSSA